MMKALLDIGKTHLKLQIVNEELETVVSYQRDNASVHAEYLHIDTNMIWNWLIHTLSQSKYTCNVCALTITTHGATAALIDINSENEDGLVLPIIDYEETRVNEIDREYNTIRPCYSKTYSPSLPAGLNLGRQLYWQNHQYPDEFAKVSHILMYPQYWGWRLCRKVANEVTSLGCHTDLWEPERKSFSQLVVDCGWMDKMPPLCVAWDCLGLITKEVAQLTGLPEECEVFVGMHDSNASYTRYLLNNPSDNESFTVISTGTWTILMQHLGKLKQLDSNKDMLANVDIHSEPVCCARFMGGREYEKICNSLGGKVSDKVTLKDIQLAVNKLWMITPDFSGGSGPFPNLKPQINIGEKSVSPAALATLYCALMIDSRLDDLKATGAVYIEGSFLKNPCLCAVLAQFRKGQTVYLSNDEAGNTLGALQLISDDTTEFKKEAFELFHPAHINGLDEYRRQWRARVHGASCESNQIQS